MEKLKDLEDKSDIQKFIIATMIADCYVDKNDSTKKARLDIYHSGKQYDYIVTKKELLERIPNIKCSLNEKKDDRLLKSGLTRIGYRLRTNFDSYFYSLNLLSEEALIRGIMNPISLAVLWQDDGGSSYRNGYFSYAVLCTESWPNSFTINFLKKLKEKYNIIGETMALSLSFGIGYRIRFTKSNFEKLVPIIDDYILKDMKYKIYPAEKLDKTYINNVVNNFVSTGDDILIT